jgi:hypothetical protein
MALSAAEETLNDAVNTLMAAWETYLDTLAAGTPFYVVPCEASYGRSTGETGTHRNGWGLDSVAAVNASAKGKAIFDPRRRQKMVLTDTTTEVAIPLRVGRWPMFFKVSNGAGDTET